MEEVTNPEELNSRTDYRIKAANKSFSGTSYGIDFQRGTAIAYGLTDEETEEEHEARVYALRQMLNTNQHRPAVDTVDDEGRPMRRDKAYTVLLDKATKAKIGRQRNEDGSFAKAEA